MNQRLWERTPGYTFDWGEVTITCPSCKHIEKRMAYISVGIYNYKCPKCGITSTVDYDQLRRMPDGHLILDRSINPIGGFSNARHF